MKYCLSIFLSIFLVLAFFDACPADDTITEKKLIASDGEAMDKFGQAVAVSGSFAIVGAHGDDDSGASSGAVYIFHHNGTSWTQTQKLTPNDGESLDKFGQAVGISGSYAIVGAGGDNDKGESAGSAYIFYYNGTSWAQVQKLTASDGTGWAMFGQAVGISGSFAVVGAYGDDDRGESSGSAYVFQHNGTSWTQTQKLTANDGAGWQKFGQSVAISDNFIFAGSGGDTINGGSAGAVYVFFNSGSSWGQVQKLAASDGAGWDKFGQSLSVSGNSAMVGAYGDDDQGASSGSAYMFYYNGSLWQEEQKLIANDGAAADYFGQAVAVAGDYAIVGAYGDDDLGISSGSAYIFHYDGNSWVQLRKLTASQAAPSDYFGQSVAIGDNFAVAGAYGFDDAGESSGSATIYGDFMTNDPPVVPDPDLDGDGDVDGLDLTAYKQQLNSGVTNMSVAEFAAAFGSSVF
ncbi:MAG: FG-GAP repeat protein [Deltaproteobacteria bacterium]|nr:FG-GAP repeat protein [Deltaproteobacteria bacterium]